MSRIHLLAVPIAVLLAAGCDRPADPVDSDPVTRPVTPPAEPAPRSPGGQTEPLAGPSPAGTPGAEPASAAAATARAVLEATEGNDVAGELVLTADNGGIRISGHLTGLQANAEHGFHIHETGDCSAPDASSAGPHFGPDDQPHGRPGSGQHHAGDMPNLTADARGEAHVDIRIDSVELGSGGPRDAAGRAIVVHQGADDFETQPAGDSGARVACGVINLAGS